MVVHSTESLPAAALSSALTALGVGVEIFGADGQRLYANEVGRALSPVDGGQPAPTRTSGPPGCINEDGSQLLEEDYCHRRVLASRSPVRSLIYGLQDAHGERRWIRAAGMPIHQQASPTGALVVTMDVTEHHDMLPALRKSERQFRTILDMAHEGLAAYDGNGRVWYVNDRMCAINGHSRADMMGRTVAEFSNHPDGQKLLDADMERFRSGISKQTQAQIGRKDGSLMWVMISSNPLVDERGDFAGGVSMMTDLTELKAAEEALKHQALFDGLTGLPNRVLFLDRLERAMSLASRESSRLAVLMFDLDRFKAVNDTLGHHCGDVLLHDFGERLNTIFRGSDTFARLGGDEFAAMLPGVSTALHAGVVIDKIERALQAPFNLEGHEVIMTTSIGLALFPENGADATTLLHFADAAMYDAKRRRPGGQAR